MLNVLLLLRSVVDFSALYLLFQDPDLEAKRKAELEKIRSKKKKFKQKIQENIQKQKSGQLKKKLMKRKQMKKKKAAAAQASA